MASMYLCRLHFQVRHPASSFRPVPVINPSTLGSEILARLILDQLFGTK